MKYNFTIKRYKLDFNSPSQSAKMCIVHHYTWTFKEFNDFVKSEQLSMYTTHLYFHPWHDIPFHDYTIGFTKKVGERDYLVYNVTVSRIVDGKLVDFNWKSFESKLSSTRFFKKYRAKRSKRGKEAVSRTVVGI